LQIPFSKFFLTHKGRIQDNQRPVNREKVSHFGITLMDATPGPFNLEIDYIGLEFDPEHNETFAYELYKHDNYIVNN
jgi:NADH dehydrogenase [ubiquinone] 1 alpha subcomplex assembly factor 1